MSKKIKNIIIILIIFILITLISIVILKVNEKKEYIREVENEIETAENVKKENVEKEQGIYLYIYCDEVLQRMFDYIAQKEEQIDNSKAIISILDERYKVDNNITEDNILQYLAKYSQINSYATKEIYKCEINQRQNSNGRYLYIKGIVRKNSEEEVIYILMKQDLINSTYSLTFLNEDQFNNQAFSELDTINIEKNDYNKNYSKGITDYQICLTYFNDYINTIKNNPKNGYKLLKEEYRDKRFGNIDNYLKYINETKNRLSKVILKKYSIEDLNGKKQYVCVDQIGNYYIFEKEDMMNYNLILDTYTTELPQFIKKYEEANDMEKVGYNIQKCIEAINNKNYSYVYSKLDETFKKNSYKTLDEFTSSIKKNLFDDNNVSGVSSLNEGNTFIYKIIVSDVNRIDKTKNMTIIMQLKENRDFIMSFSFE